MIPGDPACYRGTDILVNRFDLRDAAILKAVEYKFSSTRELELCVKPIEGEFNFKMLQQMHKHLFQDVYEWAGVIREIDFAKRNKETRMVNRFTPLELMPKKIEAFDRFLADHNNLKGLTKAQFIPLFAQVATTLNEIHPFREGNGRSIRAFMVALAKQAGFDFRMDTIDQDQWYMAIHKAQVQEDSKNPTRVLRPSPFLIEGVLSRTTEPTIDHAFARESKAKTIETHPQSLEYFERLEQIQKKVNTLPDPAQRIRLAAAAKDSIERMIKEQREISERSQALERLAKVRPEAKSQGIIYSTGADFGVMCNALIENFLDQKMCAAMAHSAAHKMAVNLMQNAEMSEVSSSSGRPGLRPH